VSQGGGTDYYQLLKATKSDIHNLYIVTMLVSASHCTNAKKSWTRVHRCRCPLICKLDKSPQSVGLGVNRYVSMCETVCECCEIKYSSPPIPLTLSFATLLQNYILPRDWKRFRQNYSVQHQWILVSKIACIELGRVGNTLLQKVSKIAVLFMKLITCVSHQIKNMEQILFYISRSKSN